VLNHAAIRHFLCRCLHVFVSRNFGSRDLRRSSARSQYAARTVHSKLSLRCKWRCFQTLLQAFVRSIRGQISSPSNSAMIQAKDRCAVSRILACSYALLLQNTRSGICNR
jgi:hypothetical protein